MKFELIEELLELLSNKNYIFELAKLSDKKVMFEFAKEMYFDEIVLGKKSTRDKPFIRWPKSPAILAYENSTKILPKNPFELCDRLKLLLQKQRNGKNSNVINEKIVAIADELVEYKCISTKQHGFLLVKSLD